MLIQDILYVLSWINPDSFFVLLIMYVDHDKYHTLLHKHFFSAKCWKYSCRLYLVLWMLATEWNSVCKTSLPATKMNDGLLCWFWVIINSMTVNDLWETVVVYDFPKSDLFPFSFCLNILARLLHVQALTPEFFICAYKLYLLLQKIYKNAVV